MDGNSSVYLCVCIVEFSIMRLIISLYLGGKHSAYLILCTVVCFVLIGSQTVRK